VAHWGEPTDTVPSFYGSVPRNILMLSIDTFRKDSLSKYGGVSYMPFLDDLVTTGFTADDHLTCSNWTFAGTTCTLLGRSNVDAGFVPSLPYASRERVADGTPFLASWLGDVGYYSVLITGNSWLSPLWNNTQGYNYVHDPDYDHAPWMGEDAFDRLERARITGDLPEDSPWFAHVHLMEPHASYRPPDEYLAGLDDLEPMDIDFNDRDEHYGANADFGDWSEEKRLLYLEHLLVRYRGELSYTDDLLKTILTDAAERGLLEDTMVVIWNDHGEQFFEHGEQTHAYSLHREENDGLWVMWAENIVPGSWSGPTTAIDMTPTLLDLQGIERPPEVTGEVLGEAAEDRARFAWSVSRGQTESMISKDGWTMLFEWHGVAWLYDRNTDPLETRQVYPDEPEKVAELWTYLQPEIERQSALGGGAVAWPDSLSDTTP
jgi:arylsulfatase A-like enzyme